MLPLLAGIVFLGVYPKPFLDRVTPSVNHLLAHVQHVDPSPTSRPRDWARWSPSAPRTSTGPCRRPRRGPLGNGAAGRPPAQSAAGVTSGAKSAAGGSSGSGGSAVRASGRWRQGLMATLALPSVRHSCGAQDGRAWARRPPPRPAAAPCVVHPTGVQGICTAANTLHIPVAYRSILPELILIVGALLVLMVSSVLPKRRRRGLCPAHRRHRPGLARRVDLAVVRRRRQEGHHHHRQLFNFDRFACSSCCSSAAPSS